MQKQYQKRMMYGWFRGFIQFIITWTFLIYFILQRWDLAKVQTTYTLAQVFASQVFDQDPLKQERPILKRSDSEVVNLILDFEHRLNEHNNPLFFSTHVLEWVRVIAHRQNKVPCMVPGRSELCWPKDQYDDILTEDYEESAY